MYVCLTFQCDMEARAKGRHWVDRNWLSPLVVDYYKCAAHGKRIKVSEHGPLIIHSCYPTMAEEELMCTSLDAVLPFTLRWLFIFYLLMCYHLYFYTRQSLSEFFHVYSPHETVRALLWYIQLSSWQNQPRTAKMPGLKVDDESRAQEGQVRETRTRTTRLAPSPF